MNSVVSEAVVGSERLVHDISFAKSVVVDVIDGEAIVVDLDTGAYYSATGFGASVVEALMGARGVTALVDDLSLRLGAGTQDVALAAQHVLRQLASFGIITSPSGSFPDAPPSIEGLPFEGLTVSRHTDMKQLLELDPVHDVDESGWPNAANTR